MMVRLFLSAGLLVGGVFMTEMEGDLLATAPGEGGPAVFHHAPKALAKDAIVEDWPRFLGPRDNGVSRETKILKTFHKSGPTLVWEMNVGEGYATPTVLGDRLVFSHRLKDGGQIVGLHPETGKEIWSFSYKTNYRDRFGFGNGPRAAPVLDDGRVYLHTVDGILYCLNLETGKKIWENDTSITFNVPQDYFGVVASPVVFGELLVANVGAPKGPCVVAFNKKNGEVVWKAGTEWGPSCASPIVATVHGKKKILVFAGGDSRPPTGGLLSLDPKTGKIEARFPFRSKKYLSVNGSSPVVVDNQVFLSTSYDTGGVLVALGKDGGAKEVWRTEDLGSHFMTPIALGGYLYGATGMNRRDTGLTCIDLSTGEKTWNIAPDLSSEREVNGELVRVPESTDLASFIWVDGHILCQGERGHLLWLDPQPDGYRELARTRLFAADNTWGVPALSRGLLYIRQNEPDKMEGTAPRILCYDLRDDE